MSTVLICAICLLSYIPSLLLVYAIMVAAGMADEKLDASIYEQGWMNE